MNRLPLFAAALGLAWLAAPAAQAFTIDDRNVTNSDGSAKFSDPGSRLTGTGDSRTTIKNGNTTLQFGAQPRGADRYFNTDRMFSPHGRPYGER